MWCLEGIGLPGLAIRVHDGDHYAQAKRKGGQVFALSRHGKVLKKPDTYLWGVHRDFHRGLVFLLQDQLEVFRKMKFTACSGLLGLRFQGAGIFMPVFWTTESWIDRVGTPFAGHGRPLTLNPEAQAPSPPQARQFAKHLPFLEEKILEDNRL